MSKADKMFKELGYGPFIKGGYSSYYSRETDRRRINFWFWEYWYDDVEAKNEVTIDDSDPTKEGFTVQEHLAIHQKMKELRWLDE